MQRTAGGLSKAGSNGACMLTSRYGGEPQLKKAILKQAIRPSGTCPRWHEGVVSLVKKKIKSTPKDVQKEVRRGGDRIMVPEQAVSWIQARQHWFVGGGIGLLVAIVLVWGYTSYEQVRERRAQMQYAHTLSKLANQQNPDVPAWGPLISELKSLCEQYRGTRAARSAQVDLAQGYFQTGQFDQAIVWDQKNLHNLKAAPAAQALVRRRLVMTYRALNQLDEALTQCAALEKAAGPALAREVQWQLGLLFAAKHDLAKAAEHFHKALEQEGTYPADGIIQAGLAQVGLIGHSPGPVPAQNSPQ